MNYQRYIIPNGLTTLNLLCGVIAIIFLFENQSEPEQPYVPVVLLGLAALFDLLDGLAAKALNSTSEFGKQLDSLADLISFGLAPSIMMYKLLIIAFTFRSDTSTFQIESASVIEHILLYSSLTLVVFAALRLARFNVSAITGNNFKGLPVPAAALVVLSVWIEFHLTDNNTLRTIILNPYLLFTLIALLSFLMVSNITMLSLKFDGITLKANPWRYALLAGAVILYVIFGFSALFYIMFYYLVLSIARNLAAEQN